MDSIMIFAGALVFCGLGLFTTCWFLHKTSKTLKQFMETDEKFIEAFHRIKDADEKFVEALHRKD